MTNISYLFIYIYIYIDILINSTETMACVKKWPIGLLNGLMMVLAKG